jgi:RNA polymerase sigma factor (sigma-70 family)
MSDARANDSPGDAPQTVEAPPLEGESKRLFEATFRQHHTSLVDYVRSQVGNDTEARDIAQEAYFRLLRYRENQDVDSLKALLFRIATNLIAMRARTARRQYWGNHRPFDEELGIPTDEPPQEQRLAQEQQLDRLMAVIQQLPAKCQQVFVLSRFHDMSYPEIAARCGISVKMVEKHITKALAICRTEVGDELS